MAINHEFWEEIVKEAKLDPNVFPALQRNNEVLKVKLSEIGWYHP